MVVNASLSMRNDDGLARSRKIDESEDYDRGMEDDGDVRRCVGKSGRLGELWCVE